jgi:alpha-galactosidase
VRVENLDYAALRHLARGWRRVRRFYAGDFYPLTPYNQRDDEWIAWQFDRAGAGGMVQAFRRPRASDATVRLRLRGLDPRARYVVRDLAGGPPKRLSGRRLMRRGLPVTVDAQPGAAVLVYRAAS